MVAPTRRPRSQTAAITPFSHHLWTGLPVPDPITFVISPQWLDRPNLYPRQATLLKIIFLRNDLLTIYDHEVIDEWEASFRASGNNGIVLNVRFRMELLRSRGYKWFREVLLVLGRRAGKGYVCGLAMSYVLWNYMALGDPQNHYGVDRDKQLTAMIYAGKKEQARANLWQDLANIVTGAPCFEPYLPERPLKESLEVFAPNDVVRIKTLSDRGIRPANQMASFSLVPKEATVMSGRGPASFMQGYDEFAHMITAGGASRSGKEVYDAATPSLDQFNRDAFIVEPSSPWQMIGQFYANWQNAQLIGDDGLPVYPTLLFLQLASWEIYYDWSEAHLLPMFPEEFTGDLGEYVEDDFPMLNELKGAIQNYDDEMEKLERANPEMFSVERRAKWQATVDAYLDPQKINEVFEPWNGREITFNHRGILTRFYKGHADPSLANANFGIAIGHPETDGDGQLHCVFDYIGFWRPSDFPDNIIDYVEIEDSIWQLIKDFVPDEFTFDQWNSAATIQRLQSKARRRGFAKSVSIFEKTATVKHNFERAENFKVAINQGWVHAPKLDQASLELRFLRMVNGKVEKQDTGPVVTKDVADCMFEVVWSILGDQVKSYIGRDMSQAMQAAAPGGMDPYSRERSQESNALLSMSPRGSRGSAARLNRAGGMNPARNPNRPRR